MKAIINTTLAAVAMAAVSCGQEAGSLKLSDEYSLVPTVDSIQVCGRGGFEVKDGIVINAAEKSLMPAAEYLKEALLPVAEAEVKAGVPEGEGIFLGLSDSVKPEGGYRLSVDKNGAKVEAADYSGIISAIATIRQLLNDGGRLPFVTVSDAPRFQWRGLMLDASRHFWSVDEVKSVLDLMASFKLNRFHWHLTDDQGWRIEIKKYPMLTEKGAWRKFNSQDLGCVQSAVNQYNPDFNIPEDKLKVEQGDTLYGGFYTQEDIRDVVAYAARRGISVVPEIDMPGHFMAAISEYPEIACTGLIGWGQTFSSPICPGKDLALEFCKNVYKEVFDLFPSEVVHMGGDEVEKGNWMKCKDCRRRMNEENLDSPEALQAWFVRSMEEFFKENGRTLVGWDEVGEDGLSSDAVIMWWRGWNPEAVPSALAAGKRAVCAPTSCMYFDYPQDRNSVRNILNYDPEDLPVEEKDKGKILGVQANLWAEWIPSLRRVEYMLLPRLLALSEIAWAEPDCKMTETDEFYGRALAHYQHFDRQGINYRIPDLEGFYNVNAFVDNAVLDVKCQLPTATIRYTTDGSVPDGNSAIYSKPIKIDSTTDFILRTFRPDGTADEYVRVRYEKQDYKPSMHLESEAALEDGLTATWYDYRGAECAGIDTADVKGVFEVENVSIPKEASGNVGLVIKGYLRIPADGIYDFALNSDDGSTLLIDGDLVIDNDGEHSPRESLSQKAMAKGFHSIEVRYFDHNGGSLKLSLIGKDGARTQMDRSWFKHD